MSSLSWVDGDYHGEQAIGAKNWWHYEMHWWPLGKELSLVLPHSYDLKKPKVVVSMH